MTDGDQNRMGDEEKTAAAGDNEPAPNRPPVEISMPVHDDEPQKEARATLAAISAALQERNKQPFTQGVGAIQQEIERGERQTRQLNEEARALRQMPPAQSESPHLQSDSRPMEKTRPLPTPPAWLKVPKVRVKPENKKIFIVALVCCTVAGTVGLMLGQRFVPEHTVVSSLMPVKDPVSGSGLPVKGGPDSDNPVADIVAQVLPTVVNIHEIPKEMRGAAQAAAFKSFEGMGEGPRLIPEEAFGNKSMGTGVIVRSDGYIITSAHVLRPGLRAIVTLNDKRSFEAKVVGKDGFTDLALLKIAADNLPVARFGKTADVRPGDWAIAIGSPLGYDHTVTLGIISAIGRSLSDLNSHVDLIQTDAAINPGNSGGPLLNIHGELVGINNAVRENAQNIGFAIPVDVVRKVADEIITKGPIRHAYLGIFMQDLNPMNAQQLGLKITNGVVVTRLIPASPCDKAGFGQFDVIEQVDGHNVASAKEVREILKEKRPGDVLEFTLMRKGSQEKRRVTAGDYPDF